MIMNEERTTIHDPTVPTEGHVAYWQDRLDGYRIKFAEARSTHAEDLKRGNDARVERKKDEIKRKKDENDARELRAQQEEDERVEYITRIEEQLHQRCRVACSPERLVWCG